MVSYGYYIVNVARNSNCRGKQKMGFISEIRLDLAGCMDIERGKMMSILWI